MVSKIVRTLHSWRTPQAWNLPSTWRWLETPPSPVIPILEPFGFTLICTPMILNHFKTMATPQITSWCLTNSWRRRTASSRISWSALWRWQCLQTLRRGETFTRIEPLASRQHSGYSSWKFRHPSQGTWIRNLLSTIVPSYPTMRLHCSYHVLHWVKVTLMFMSLRGIIDQPSTPTIGVVWVSSRIRWWFLIRAI